MVSEHKDLLSAIEREFIQLGYRWQLFCQLFDSGQKNVDLLNKSGSNVFQLLQKLILDDVMMALCRLSDPDRSMGKENASIRNMFKKVSAELSDEDNREIDAKLSELKEHMKNISILRNKAISHTDYGHALNTELLPRPTYDEIENSMKAIEKTLNIITGKLYDYSSSYLPSMPYGHDGNELLNVLSNAHESNQNVG